MTSFLFQFQIQPENIQKTSQFFVLNISRKCSSVFGGFTYYFIHHMLTFLICLDAAYLLNFCKVCQLVFILSGFVFVFFLELYIIRHGLFLIRYWFCKKNLAHFLKIAGSACKNPAQTHH